MGYDTDMLEGFEVLEGLEAPITMQQAVNAVNGAAAAVYIWGLAQLF